MEYAIKESYLRTGPIWTRRTCCLIYRENQVISEFHPTHLLERHDQVEARTKVDFTLRCFTDDSFSDAAAIVVDDGANNTVIRRGQQLFCR